MSKARQNLKDALERCGVSMKEASLFLGKSHAYIFGYLSKGSPKKLDGDDRRKLSKLLKVSEQDLVDEYSSIDRIDYTVKQSIAGIPLSGTVAAGVWREASVVSLLEVDIVPVMPDPRYPIADQFALQVEGTSMNKIFQPGEFAHCVRWEAVGREIRDGDLVVVERRRSGLVEATLKRVRINGDYELWPESTDPRFSEPLNLPNGPTLDDAADEIIVTAQVIGRYARLG
jgi:SOS-response transcriptional repressor LexA